MSSHGRRGEGFLWGLFYERTNPYNHLPKAPPTNALTNGIRFQHMNLRWIHSAPNKVLLLFLRLKKKKKKTKEAMYFQEFTGGPVFETQHFHCRGHELDSWSGN